MEKDFDIEKWRTETPMDYLKILGILNQSSDDDAIQKVIHETIYKITRLYLPDTLYKYYSLTDNVQLNSSKLDTLRKKQIFMSDATNLNDPFDSKAFYYRPDVLLKYPSLKAFNGKVIDDFTKVAKVASFTACGINSMPMWAHYAANHCGFCVAYSLKDERNLELSSSMFPVQYTPERIDISDYLDRQIGLITTATESGIAQGMAAIHKVSVALAHIFAYFVNIKHSSWSYEQEFRYTLGANINGMSYAKAVPKEIFIGAKCSPANRCELISIAQYLSIPISQMKYDDSSADFSLSIEKIDK